jgi:molybdopterin converting factor small subunit
MVKLRVVGDLWEHLEPSLELDLEGRDVTVDRRQSTLDEIVPADGRVCIFPPMSGG